MTSALLLAAGSSGAHNARLITAALLAIAAVVVLIAWLKVNPFLALLLGSAVLAGVAGLAAAKAIDSFQKGVGDTFGSVGILVALGAIVGKLLVDSGGASRVVDTIVSRVRPGALPWAMAGAAALIGLPMFFEIGVVLLIPIVLLVARRSGLPLLKVGIPALAGLSVLHGLVPPHPGPLTAIGALKADVGVTLGLGLIVAIPTVIIAGPIFGHFIAPYGPLHPPAAAGGGVVAAEEEEEELVAVGGGRGARRADHDRPAVRTGAGGSHAAGVDREDSYNAEVDRGDGNAPGAVAGEARRQPSFAVTVAVVLLPVVMMMGKAFADLVLRSGTRPRAILDVVGTPVIALTAGTIAAMFALGIAVGMNKRGLGQVVDSALPPMAGTLLIIAAGGGFKQVLVDSGVGKLIGDWAQGKNLSPLVLGWLVAVGIRLATGSATVATITAAGIVAPLAAAEHLDTTHVSLLVLAIGSGSLFFSHVNDVGFWLIKQYFGMTVWETIKSWSVMETIISVCGLVGVLLLNLVI